MPCTPFRTDDGATGFICTGRARRRAKCFYCTEQHDVLCDWPTGEGKTCDRKCCRKHAKNVGADRDLCLQHAAEQEKAERARRATIVPPPSVPAPAGAPPAEAAPAPLRVCTGNVNRHRRDPDALDVTIMTGGDEGRPFAPSMVLFTEAKRGGQRVEALRIQARSAEIANDPATAGALRAEAAQLEAQVWARYRRGYLAEMILSSGRPVPEGWDADVRAARERGVTEHLQAWAELLRRKRVVLLCFEPDRVRCHRGLLTQILVKLGATDGGELPVAPGQQPLFASNQPKG